MTWTVNIITYFPQIYPGPLSLSVLGRGLKSGLWDIKVHDIRQFGIGKHKIVDETCYGGGSGMVIRPDVLGGAIEELFLPNGHDIIYLSPGGDIFNQSMARNFVQRKGLNIICGRFEGIDERIITEYNVQEISIGDYILTSGDTAAIVLIDACARLVPGVIKDAAATTEESFAQEGDFAGLLEYPHYTKPYSWKGRDVPGVLLSGNHRDVHRWRLNKAKEKTQRVRPDLPDQCE